MAEMEYFTLNRDTKLINSDFPEKPVERAVRRFYRDMDMALLPGPRERAGGRIRLCRACLPPEQYRICPASGDELVIEASDELGVIYALIYISRAYLGILPFWFWNDQKIERKESALISQAVCESKEPPVRYRGWFINDEVLISAWDAGIDQDYPWEMVFEALLRCGGNLVIPGTDRNAKTYEKLASEMGLWITQHHAEPLGAEMFARAYPDRTPSYQEAPELFRGLWEEGILRQKNYKVIWNIGFRGQGDIPFWEQDPAYDTPQKRGELISRILKEQCALVRCHVENPVFCTNLYGETMELYQQGMIKLPEDVIMVWADNGYGKMVSRRQGNHNPRIPALPAAWQPGQRHGVYYHVSFYDLQAANHITMIPNSMEFVERELKSAYGRGIRCMWLINASNIKPHVYPLDFLAGLWNGENLTPQEHLRHYLAEYFPQCAGGAKGRDLLTAMASCFQDYHRAAVPFGVEEDEHAGEQFYNYVTRELSCCWIRDGGKAACRTLFWCTEEESLGRQVRWYRTLCEGCLPAFTRLWERCADLSGSGGRLWEDSILLQVKIHRCCLEGAVLFGEAFDKYEAGELMGAFFTLGRAADCYQEAAEAMEACSHGKWRGFYHNECLTDVKETAYLLRRVMSYVRILGDGPYFYGWQREVIYPPEDRRVVLLTNFENHMTDEALYQAMKKNGVPGI